MYKRQPCLLHSSFKVPVLDQLGVFHGSELAFVWQTPWPLVPDVFTPVESKTLNPKP